MDIKDRKTLLKNTFDTISEGYDNHALRFFSESAKHLVSYLNLEGDEHVLDVATGTGIVVLTLAKHLPSGRITGIDFSEGMLSQARAKQRKSNIHNAEFLKMDMEAIEYPKNHFDAAVCAFGLFYVEDMQGQLSHISDKVKPGGKILITSFQEKSFLPLVEMFLDRIQKYGIETPVVPWEHLETEDVCTSLFKTVGLKDVNCRQKDISYYLRNADEWWDIVWNGGYRRFVNQLSPNDMKRFKDEHLKEVKELSSDNGIRLQVIILYTAGTKP